MNFALYLQDTPKRFTPGGDFEAQFVLVAKIKAASSEEAWKIAKRYYRHIKWPVLERDAWSGF